MHTVIIRKKLIAPASTSIEPRTSLGDAAVPRLLLPLTGNYGRHRLRPGWRKGVSVWNHLPAEPAAGESSDPPARWLCPALVSSSCPQDPSDETIRHCDRMRGVHPWISTGALFRA